MVAPSLLEQELITRPHGPYRATPVRRRRGLGRLLRRRPAAPDAPAGAAVAFTIRRATEADAQRLADLARMDTSRPLAGPALVAELDGALVAALDMHTHRAVADPFRPSAEAVELLRLRAAQLLNAEAYSQSRPAALAPGAPRWTPGAPHH